MRFLPLLIPVLLASAFAFAPQVPAFALVSQGGGNVDDQAKPSLKDAPGGGAAPAPGPARAPSPKLELHKKNKKKPSPAPSPTPRH